MKRAIQLDLTLDQVPGAAAVAQKDESGGAVSKTSVNKHRRRVFQERREWMLSSCYHWV